MGVLFSNKWIGVIWNEHEKILYYHINGITKRVFLDDKVINDYIKYLKQNNLINYEDKDKYDILDLLLVLDGEVKNIADENVYKYLDKIGFECEFNEDDLITYIWHYIHNEIPGYYLIRAL